MLWNILKIALLFVNIPHMFKIKMYLMGFYICLLDHLNQIPYDYTVEVRNRFKELDLIDSPMNYGWGFVTLYRRQASRPSPRKRNANKQNGCLRRPYTQLWNEEWPKKRWKGMIYLFDAEFQRIARRDKKAFLSEQCKEIE